MGGGVSTQFTTLIQQIVNGLSMGSVYALIAVGYSLVYSILSFSNFAHGGFLVVGGYICYGLLAGFNITSATAVPPVGSIWIAGAGALIGAGIVAALTERLAYKPIRERTSLTLYLLIASMGMSIVIENIFVIVVGGRYRALPPDAFEGVFFFLEKYLIRICSFFGAELRIENHLLIFGGDAAVNGGVAVSGGAVVSGGVTVSMFDILSFLVTVVFLGGLQLFISRTRWGLAIRAAACDLRTAGLMGVNVSLLIGIVFFTAGLLAAVGGIFLSFRYTLYPQLGGITIKAFVAAVIGGLGSLPGAVIGSLVLGLAEMLTAGFISSQMRDLVVFSMLVLMLLVKPAGFFGKQIGDKI